MARRQPRGASRQKFVPRRGNQLSLRVCAPRPNPGRTDKPTTESPFHRRSSAATQATVRLPARVRSAAGQRDLRATSYATRLLSPGGGERRVAPPASPTERTRAICPRTEDEFFRPTRAPGRRLREVASARDS